MPSIIQDRRRLLLVLSLFFVIATIWLVNLSSNDSLSHARPISKAGYDFVDAEPNGKSFKAVSQSDPDEQSEGHEGDQSVIKRTDHKDPVKLRPVRNQVSDQIGPIRDERPRSDGHVRKGSARSGPVESVPVKSILPDKTVSSFTGHQAVPLLCAKLELVNVDTLPHNESMTCLPLNLAVHKELICIDDEDKYIGHSIRTSGSWEPHIFQAMKGIFALDPDLNLIDIGANIGVYVISVASMGRKVLAVEAFWENIVRMGQSIRLGDLQDKVTVVHNAVSNVYENVTFYRPPDNPGGTHTLSEGTNLNIKRYDGDHNSVSTIQIDDLLKIMPFGKAVMKIDIEGFEVNAMNGAKRFLKEFNVDHIFMEWGGVRGQQDCMQIVDIMLENGFKAHSVQLEMLENHEWPGVKEWPFDIIWLRVGAIF